jgi:hypothetical protein
MGVGTNHSAVRSVPAAALEYHCRGGESSDLRLLSDLERAVDLNTKVAHGRLQNGGYVAKLTLRHRSKNG